MSLLCIAGVRVSTSSQKSGYSVVMIGRQRVVAYLSSVG